MNTLNVYYASTSVNLWSIATSRVTQKKLSEVICVIRILITFFFIFFMFSQIQVLATTPRICFVKDRVDGVYPEDMLTPVE